jgi:hypothetical protein
MEYERKSDQNIAAFCIGMMIFSSKVNWLVVLSCFVCDGGFY